VAEVTRGLGVDRFGVVGWSGGAPFAAAVAATMPDRLTGVCLASSASLAFILEGAERDADDLRNIDAIREFGAVAATLRYAEEIRDWAAGVLRDPAGLITDDELADGDRWLMDDPDVAADVFDAFR
jgi:pimeloyl-ACP methyl ester carboxylesterase